jgi:PAS domain S-box-containing protein
VSRRPGVPDDVAQPVVWDVFPHALDAMFLVDADGAFIDVNPAACELTGYRREELMGRHISFLAPEGQGEEVDRTFEELLQAGRSDIPFDLRRRDGSVITAEARAVADIVPGVHLSVLRDITDRVVAERAAAEREEQIGLILDQLPAVLWTVDEELRFTFSRGNPTPDFDPAPSSPVVLDLRLEDLPWGECRGVILAAHRRALDGAASRYEAVVGDRVWFCHVEPLRSRAGDILGVVGVGLDLTEVSRLHASIEDTVRAMDELDAERRLAEALERARGEERTRLARDLHDDLGHSLALLALLTQVLLRDTGPELHDRLAELHELAQGAVRAGRSLVGQLRHDRPDESPLGVRLRRMAAEIESRHGVPVEVSVDADGVVLPVTVAAAAYRIASEAVMNAVKHADADVVSVVAVMDRERLTLVIEDDGGGFAVEPVGASTRGHGLVGMRERAVELGGTVTIASVPKKGTMIRAEIPFASP